MYKFPKKRQLGQDAIPTTSLADMMFLLLIFFIMTTTLSRVTGFVTDMPASSKESQAQQDKTPTVSMHEDKILFNDQDVSMEGLANQLRNLHLDRKTGDGKVVILSTAGNVKYQNYYEAMAIIQSCGGAVAIVSEDTK